MALIGPTVCELDGPIPILNKSNIELGKKPITYKEFLEIVKPNGINIF